MKRGIFAFVAAAVLSAHASAQTPPLPGYLTISMSGIGAGGVAGVSGDARLPIRTRDAGVVDGILQVRASGARGSIRGVQFVIRSATAGHRYEAGRDAEMIFTFASGNAYTVDGRRGWVQVNDVDAHRATGSFEATLTSARPPLVVRGEFEARY